MVRRSFSKPEKLLVSGLIVMIGFLFAIAYHYYLGVILGRPYPENTFLFRPDDRMGDWGGAYEFVWDLDPFHSTYRGQGNNYPPAG